MSTLGKDFARIMGRDLDRLRDEVEAYASDADLWRVRGEIKNSAGTLALHLAGNLDHFVGAVLGHSGYVRDREAEFGDRDVPRDEILHRVASCRSAVVGTLNGLSDAALQLPYPGQLPPPLAGSTTHLFLVHLAGHLTWHLGQINYHRRLLAAGD
jgi:hypothetical protein